MTILLVIFLFLLWTAIGFFVNISLAFIDCKISNTKLEQETYLGCLALSSLFPIILCFAIGWVIGIKSYHLLLKIFKADDFEGVLERLYGWMFK